MRGIGAAADCSPNKRFVLCRAFATRPRIGETRRPKAIARYQRNRLTQTARLWLDVIAEEQRKLAHEEAEHPQVPQVFIVIRSCR